MNLFIIPPEISLLSAITLLLFSFITSAITAAFGIGGGTALLGVLSSTIPVNIIIAIHGIVQFGSNIGRAYIQRKYIEWHLVGHFTLGAIIGVAIGAWLFVQIPERVLFFILGSFILCILYLPKSKILAFPTSGIFLGGVFSSILTMIIGATGPFVQAILLDILNDRRKIIANQAIMMSIQHGFKIVAFGLIGISIMPWLPLILGMVLTGFLGTFFGTKLLDKLPEYIFRKVIKIFLTIIAISLLWNAVK